MLNFFAIKVILNGLELVDYRRQSIGHMNLQSKQNETEMKIVLLYIYIYIYKDNIS